MTTSAWTPRQPASSLTPVRVAIFSFIWPGLGHLAMGRRRVALAFAVPAVIAALVILYELRDGVDILLARALLVPTGARVLVISAILLGSWRLIALGHAIRLAGGIRPPEATPGGQTSGRRQPRSTTVLVAVLVALIVIPHTLIAWVGFSFLDASSQIYVSTDPLPGASPMPSGATGDIGTLPTPYATPTAGGRFNVLIVGADSGLGYNHSLTDSMIVVSVDPATKHVDMLSFPRDIARFPLYNGGIYEGKLNSLVTYAAQNPRQFPDGGLGTLTREIGFLLGVPIHYYAFLNLAGFKTVVDAVGGVNVVNEKPIADAGYEFPDGVRGFFLSAGPHHLDGRTALAFVRTRQGPGDNDFTRARRQQQVLLALRSRLTDPSLLPRLSSILKAFAATVQTDYPADSVPDLLILARQFSDSNVDHYVLGPPYARQPADSGGIYMLVLDRTRIAALSVRLFGAESAYASIPVPSP